MDRAEEGQLPRLERVTVAARLRDAGCVHPQDEATLLVDTAADDGELERFVVRRAAGEPIEQIVGWAMLGDVRITVAPGVFVPRARSAWLVERALAAIAPGDTVLDLGCGSGAVGLAIAASVPVDLHAVDLDPTAAAVARPAVEAVGGRVYVGDLFEPLPSTLAGRVDLLVANLPYVPTDEIAFLPSEARLHEPAVALDGGPDGLAVARRMLAAVGGWLAPDARVLVEVGERQAPGVIAEMALHGLRGTTARSAALEATVVEGVPDPRSDFGSRPGEPIGQDDPRS